MATLDDVFIPEKGKNNTLYELQKEYPNIELSVIKEAAKIHDSNINAVMSNVETVIYGNIEDSVLIELLSDIYSACSNGYMTYGYLTKNSTEAVIQLTLKEAAKLFELDKVFKEKNVNYNISLNKEFLPNGLSFSISNIVEKGKGIDMDLLKYNIDKVKTNKENYEIHQMLH